MTKNSLRDSDVGRRETTRSLNHLGSPHCYFSSVEPLVKQIGGLEMAIISGNTVQDLTPSQYMLLVGDAVITIQDKQFFDGFQYGFQNFQKGKVLTDQDLYLACLQIVDVKKSGRYQSGVIVGKIAAMLDMQGNNEYKLFDIAPQIISTPQGAS